MSVLKIRDFRWLLLIQLFSTLGTQMLGLIVSWQLYQMTHDPLALGLIGLSEALAFISSAPWSGHRADRSEKSQTIQFGQILLLGVGLGLMILTLRSNRAAWPIYGLLAISGLARSLIWTSRVPFIEQIVPKAIYREAAAWNSSLWELSTILGPAAGGLLYGFWGPVVAYQVALAFLVASFFFGCCLSRHPAVSENVSRGKESDWRSGIRFVFSDQIILAALSLDMFAVFFGGAVALLPIFAERMGAGPQGLGFLRAAPSLGAVAMALYQMHRPVSGHRGRALLVCVSLFGVSMIAFGLSTSFWLSFAILVFSGLVDNVSVVTRASILQALTPDHMRGRVSAVNGIFIGSSNEIGAFESGLAAKLMGVVPSVLFGGVMTLVTVAIVAWKAPKLRQLQRV